MLKRAVPCAAMIALAVNHPAASDPGEIEELLVTGTHAPVPELTASLSVLDQAVIQALNKRSLAEVLRTVPGLLVEQQGGPGGLTAVSIRGAEANFTLVLLDGVCQLVGEDKAPSGRIGRICAPLEEDMPPNCEGLGVQLAAELVGALAGVDLHPAEIVTHLGAHLRFHPWRQPFPIPA